MGEHTPNVALKISGRYSWDDLASAPGVYPDANLLPKWIDVQQGRVRFGVGQWPHSAPDFVRRGFLWAEEDGPRDACFWSVDGTATTFVLFILRLRRMSGA